MKVSAVFAVGLHVATVLAGCEDNADGFASLNGGTTGGNGGTVVTVSNFDDLKKYASASGKYVIKVSGKITVSPFGYEIPIANDKTIIGLGSTGEIYQGGFGLKPANNVIIRNLKIGMAIRNGNFTFEHLITSCKGNTDDGTEDDNDRDGIQADTSSNIWIDHCTFENGGDGLVDLRKDTTYYTVSNNIFRSHDKTFGIGWTDNVVAQATIHHNLFDGTNQRNPSADNLKYAHLYNNYLRGITSYGHYARGKTNARVENCYFESSKNPLQADSTATLTGKGNVFKSCSGTQSSDQGTSFDPNNFYQYTLDSANDVPSKVLANAGPKASICS